MHSVDMEDDIVPKYPEGKKNIFINNINSPFLLFENKPNFARPIFCSCEDIFQTRRN
jgi:hypothetical protein